MLLTRSWNDAIDILCFVVQCYCSQKSARRPALALSPPVLRRINEPTGMQPLLHLTASAAHEMNSAGLMTRQACLSSSSPTQVVAQFSNEPVEVDGNLPRPW